MEELNPSARARIREALIAEAKALGLLKSGLVYTTDEEEKASKTLRLRHGFISTEHVQRGWLAVSVRRGKDSEAIRTRLIEAGCISRGGGFIAYCDHADRISEILGGA